MRVEQTFTVARPPEAVFDEVTDPAKLATWQTSKTAGRRACSPRS
ncbi:MAG: hypothetical protein QOD81_3128 [Solirubrobacteraceae bacterium]|jgi:uncharacterized protein YndB with AHSA1/START domain|nr:hypothetical protein [Solirubrobacteraceae bacterium]